MNNNQLANTNALTTDQFLSMMAQTEMRKESRPRPKSVRLNGQTGKWECRTWNAEKKEMESVAYGENGVWNGSILLVKWFAKWKFNDKAKSTYRTREFGTFDDGVELLEIDYTKGEDATVSKGLYPDYKTFKAEYVVKDKLTGKETSPFDLWFSIYVMDLSNGEVVNFRGKGQTRSNLWDYLAAYKKQQPSARAMVEVGTSFGIERHEMPGDASKEYYAATLKASRLLTDTELLQSKDCVTGLVAWMKSFETVDEDAPVIMEPTVTPLKDDNISLDQIPF